MKKKKNTYEWKVGAGVSFAGVALAVIFYICNPAVNFRSKVPFEIFKFALLTMATGGLLVIYRSMVNTFEERAKQRQIDALNEHEAQRQKKDDLRALYDSTVEIHNHIKAVRRELRAYGTFSPSGGFEISEKYYFPRLERLNNSQLELGALKRTLNHSFDFLGNDKENLKDSINDAKDFLEKTVEEFEKSDAPTNEKPRCFSVESKTYHFVKPAARGSDVVKKEFFDRMSAIRKIIIKHINSDEKVGYLTEDSNDDLDTQKPITGLETAAENSENPPSL